MILAAHSQGPTLQVHKVSHDTTMYVVQVNGKMRGKWLMPKDKSEEELLAFIKTQPQIAKHITGDIAKVVYVPNKLVNLVIHV